jgi:hypothetical protein
VGREIKALRIGCIHCQAVEMRLLRQLVDARGRLGMGAAGEEGRTGHYHKREGGNKDEGSSSHGVIPSEKPGSLG